MDKMHITLPAQASHLLDGLPLILEGWDAEEIDAEIDNRVWEGIPEKLKKQPFDAIQYRKEKA